MVEDPDQLRAYGLLTDVGRHVEEDDLDAACAAASRLGDLIAARPDDATLPGFSTMALDAALWLLAGGRDAEALALCEPLAARLAPGTPAQQAAAAGARFLAAQAAAQTGDGAGARAQLAALATMGEPALAAMERMAGRLAASAADPAWHAQVAAVTATVLWRLGRVADAELFARESAASFERLGRRDLRDRLTALAREITAADLPADGSAPSGPAGSTSIRS